MFFFGYGIRSVIGTVETNNGGGYNNVNTNHMSKRMRMSNIIV